MSYTFSSAIAAPIAAVLFSFTTSTIQAAVTVDEKLPAYTTVTGVSGKLNSVGSDTLNDLMTFWAEGFQGIYPNVLPEINAPGSSAAPPALVAGTAQLGPMRREMKSNEIDAFEKKYSYKPTAIKVCIDALAVFVHKDNPIKGMTLAQVDSVFSSTYKRGGKNISEWGDLLPEWKGKSVSIFGRNSASGTNGFFKENALSKGDYKATVKEQPGSSGVVQAIGSDLYGIGYSGIGYDTSGVRALSLADKGEMMEPSYENCLSGKYPLARFLMVYVNKKPGQPLDTLTLEFMKFVLSKEGQEIVVKAHYFPLPAEIAKETLEQLTK